MSGRPAGRPSLLALVTLAMGLAPSHLFAQFGPVDPGQMGTAFTSGAFARGWEAVGVNPAALGLPHRPRGSVAIPTFALRQTLRPVGFRDVTAFQGTPIPRAEREAWIRHIDSAGGQEGSGSAQVAGLSGSWGTVGFQHATTAWADARLNPAAAELLLFGNAGRTGEPGDFALEGSRLDLGAFSTFSVAAALPLVSDGEGSRGLALGVGLRFLVAHGLVMARDLGSLVGADPVAVELNFPLVTPAGRSMGWERGRGVGLDLGSAWSAGPWTGFLTVQDAVNTFGWDLAQMEFSAPGRQRSRRGGGARTSSRAPWKRPRMPCCPRWRISPSALPSWWELDTPELGISGSRPSSGGRGREGSSPGPGPRPASGPSGGDGPPCPCGWGSPMSPMACGWEAGRAWSSAPWPSPPPSSTRVVPGEADTTFPSDSPEPGSDLRSRFSALWFGATGPWLEPPRPPGRSSRYFRIVGTSNSTTVAPHTSSAITDRRRTRRSQGAGARRPWRNRTEASAPPSSSYTSHRSEAGSGPSRSSAFARA